jgi:putative transposase
MYCHLGREELIYGFLPKKRYTEAQTAFALRQAESGTPVAEIIRKMGISEVTFYRWKKRFAGMGVAEIRRLKQLEDENRRLKQMVADLTLEKQMLQDVLSKKALRPSVKRELVEEMKTFARYPNGGPARICIFLVLLSVTGV